MQPAQLFLPIESKRLQKGVWRTAKGWLAWVGESNEGIVICGSRVIPLRWDDAGRAITRSRMYRGRWGVKAWVLKEHQGTRHTCPIFEVIVQQTTLCNFQNDLASAMFR